MQPLDSQELQKKIRHGLGRHAFLQGLQTLADGLLQTCAATGVVWRFMSPKSNVDTVDRVDSYQQQSTTINIYQQHSTSLQILQRYYRVSCHVLPSWPLRPLFATDVLEVAGAPHPGGAGEQPSSVCRF